MPPPPPQLKCASYAPALLCCPVITVVAFQSLQAFIKGCNFTANASGTCQTTIFYLILKWHYCCDSSILVFHTESIQQHCRNCCTHVTASPVKLLF